MSAHSLLFLINCINSHSVYTQTSTDTLSPNQSHNNRACFIEECCVHTLNLYIICMGGQWRCIDERSQHKRPTSLPTAHHMNKCSGKRHTLATTPHTLCEHVCINSVILCVSCVLYRLCFSTEERKNTEMGMNYTNHISKLRKNKNKKRINACNCCCSLLRLL